MSQVDVASSAEPASLPRYDELRDAAGAVRPTWKPLADALTGMPPGRLCAPRRRRAGDDPRQWRDL